MKFGRFHVAQRKLPLKAFTQILDNRQEHKQHNQADKPHRKQCHFLAYRQAKYNAEHHGNNHAKDNCAFNQPRIQRLEVLVAAQHLFAIFLLIGQGARNPRQAQAARGNLHVFAVINAAFTQLLGKCAIHARKRRTQAHAQH